MPIDQTKLSWVGLGECGQVVCGGVPTFEPPAVEYAGGPPEDRLFGRMKFQVGTTVLKNGASYVAYQNPTDELVAAADEVYLGGHSTTLTTTDEIAALEAAGYEVQGP